MNLIQLPNFNKIYMVEPFKKELDKLFNKSIAGKTEYEFYLREMLRILDNAKTPPSQKPFEPIKGTKYSFYRIESKSKKKNIRIIYYWDTGGEVTLLTAFEEKARSDYDEAVARSESRIKIIKNGV